MDQFHQGILATVSMLGGLCAFIYWMFNMMEKRFETKLDSISSDVHKVAEELKEERKSKDYLYKFVIEHVKK